MEGFKPTSWKNADIVLVNGCTVTARADQKLRQFVHRIRRENPQAKILITGCTAIAMNNELLPPISGTALIDKSHRYDIAKLFESTEIDSKYIQPDNDLKCISDTSPMELDFPIIYGLNISRTRARLKIQDGCDNRCAYCIVPLVRGNSRSRPLDKIIHQMEILIDKGFKEIVLTGVDIGDWNYDNLHLADLIRRILDETKVYQLRLSSLEPPSLSDELVNLIASEERIAPHLHIPLQSGSDRLLRKMNRPQYDVMAIMKKLQNIRLQREEVCFGADIIVGYPAETAEDFSKTESILESGVFAYSHIFKFSPRPGTKASNLKLIPGNVMSERAERLQYLDRKNRYNFAKQFLGKKLEFIVEQSKPISSVSAGRMSDKGEIADRIAIGHTGNYLKVYAKGVASKGSIAYFRVEDFAEMKVSGKIVK